ncbi:MAG: energy transducer TonB [Brevundimonas sp.]
MTPTALLLLALVQEPVPPAPAALPVAPRLDVLPRFQSRPRLEDIFPVRAIEQAVSGTAQVRCLSGTDGRLHDCRITRETPLGWGFGQAALDGMARATLKPGEVDGQPVETQVAQVFTFRGVGTVELDCAVGPNQKAKDCRVASEEPSGRGLGQQALLRAATASPDRWSLARAKDGRFQWMMDIEAPLEDCPLIAGRPICQPPPVD